MQVFPCTFSLFAITYFHILQLMTHKIQFDPLKRFSPEQAVQIPVIAIRRGFANADELLADLVKRDLFPGKPAKPARKQKGGAK